MQSLMRAVCIAYLVFLTLLLLSEDPTRVIGLHGRMPWILQVLMPYAHVLSFAVLAVLALGVRWPVPRWGIVLMMAVYGGLTEILQGFTAHRHPRLADWLQRPGGHRHRHGAVLGCRVDGRQIHQVAAESRRRFPSGSVR